MIHPRRLASLLFLSLLTLPLTAQLRFADDFEQPHEGWRFVGAHALTRMDTGDPEHGHALHLRPDNYVFALVEDSDQWGDVRIEGEVLFPDDSQNYLGVIYHYTETGARVDFGSIYIKGNSSYLRMNPFRDGNVSWTLYEEFRTPLTGEDAIVIGQWMPFKAEVVGGTCHFYVGDMETPKVTFPYAGTTHGLVGFNPRIVGGPVWIDNIRITSIDGFSYTGPPRPNVAYQPEALLTDWDVLGPLAQPSLAIEQSQAADAGVVTSGIPYAWQPAPVDARGAVVTGAVTEYLGPRPVAYFRTVVHADAAKQMDLHFSTSEELALWVNGQFEGYIYPTSFFAWYDFWQNPDHAGDAGPIQLQAGPNQILVRARGGRFAQAGFFARLSDL